MSTKGTHPKHGKEPIMDHVPPCYPPDFREKFSEEWEDVCYRLIRSGADLSKIVLNSKG